MILVLETSTTSIKALVYDVILKQSYLHTSLYKQGTSTDTESVFAQVASVISSITFPRPIMKIVLISTWHSLLLTDRFGKPVSPIMNWDNIEAAPFVSSLREDERYVDEFYQQSGCMVHALYPYFKLLHLKHSKSLNENTLIFDLGSYIFYQLTNQRASTASIASGMGYINLQTQQYNPRISSELGVDIEAQLPSLQPLEFSAPLSSAAAKLLGLQEGIPVMPCLPDGGLNQIGSGADSHGIATLSMGTSGAIRVASDKPILSPNRSTWCYLFPKGYLAGAATSGCCNCVDWAKSTYFAPTKTYKEIEESISAETDVPIFLPFLFGERCPGWNDQHRASFQEITSNHTPTHLYQAVLEGTIYNLFQCYLELKSLGIPITEIKMSGGVLYSPVWKQMCCDIFGRPITEDSVAQSSLQGGLKLALELMNLQPLPLQKEYILNPNTDVAPFYAHRYKQYLHWYYNI